MHAAHDRRLHHFGIGELLEDFEAPTSVSAPVITCDLAAIHRVGHRMLRDVQAFLGVVISTVLFSV